MKICFFSDPTPRRSYKTNQKTFESLVHIAMKRIKKKHKANYSSKR